MARWHGAVWAPLPENDTQPPIEPVRVILHTAVDSPGPSNLPAWFGRENVRVESHLWFPFAGPPVQMIDTEVRADANYRANRDSISAETEDDGDPIGNPWNAHQIDGLARFLAWCHETYRIPLRLCQSPTSPGVGWHAQWSYPSDPFGQTGSPADSPWTTSLGKICPGKTRIRQLVDVVLPTAIEIAAGSTPDRLTSAQAALLFGALVGRAPTSAELESLEAEARDLPAYQAIWPVLALVRDVRGDGPSNWGDAVRALQARLDAQHRVGADTADRIDAIEQALRDVAARLTG